MDIREFAVFDIEQVLSLWRDTEGICLHDDSGNRDAIELYLYRNPGTSFVAVDSGRIIGAVLCGHDSRRGMLHHLAVAPKYRRRGIATKLVNKAIEALQRKSIKGCNICVLKENDLAEAFWKKTGWFECDEIKVLAKKITL